MTDTTVPVIDMSPYLRGTSEGKKSVARQIDRACREIGFFMIVGHGVPQNLIDDVMRIGWALFDKSEEEKRRWMSSAGNFRRGYLPVGGNTLSYTLEDSESPPDLLEAYTLGKFDLPDDAYHNAVKDTFYEPNIWPDSLPEFEPLLKTYYREMEFVAWNLMRSFALALDLPERFFDHKIDKHITAMRINHYPEPPGTPAPGQLRAGAHTDYGSLTILLPTAAPGGLQVRGRDGEWHNVSPFPEISGTFVVNLGDLMERWTNDRWVSTLHRVVLPEPDEVLGSRRLSVAFFHQPNYDAVIECIETCNGPDNPPKYPPITSGEHLTSKTTKEQTSYRKQA